MLFIQKMKMVYEGLLLRLLFLLMACSSNDSSVSTNTNATENESVKQNSTISAATLGRRDSLLVNSNQIVVTLDSLHQAGISGTDSLKTYVMHYKELVNSWYGSELSEDIKMCVDVKRIFLINDELISRHLDNYLDLVTRINSKLQQGDKDSLRRQYQLQLSRDVLHFLQPLNHKLDFITASSIKDNAVFCPDSYSKEKEKQLKGKAGKEDEMKIVLAQFQANPIVQTYTFYKKQQKNLKADLIDLNRRYHLFL